MFPESLNYTVKILTGVTGAFANYLDSKKTDSDGGAAITANEAVIVGINIAASLAADNNVSIAKLRESLIKSGFNVIE